MDVITVGGTEHDDTTPPPRGGSRRPGVVMAVGGLVAGLAMGVVFAGGDNEPTTTSTTLPDSVVSPSASPTTTTTTIPVRVERLATMAPGVTDTLVMVSVNSTGVASVTVWDPAGRSPTPSSLPVGLLDADTSRQWLAVETNSRWADQQTLWVGNAAYMEPLIVAPITGFTWHERFFGELAWVEWDGIEGQLKTVELIPGRAAVPRTITTLDTTARPVWWTDEGIVLHEETADGIELVLVTLDGAEAARFPIQGFVSGSGSLAAVIDREGGPLLLDSSLEPLGPAPWDPECSSGEFNESGTGLAIALHCVRRAAPSTLEIWTTGEGGFGVVATVEAPNGSDPGWLANSGVAYIVSANPLRPSSELIFLRAIDGEVLTVTHPGRVTQMETMRN